MWAGNSEVKRPPSANPQRSCAVSPPFVSRTRPRFTSGATCTFLWDHAEPCCNLLQLLSDMGFRYGTYLWDPAYKGLDDYIWEYLFRKKQSK